VLQPAGPSYLPIPVFCQWINRRKFRIPFFWKMVMETCRFVRILLNSDFFLLNLLFLPHRHYCLASLFILPRHCSKPDQYVHLNLSSAFRPFLHCHLTLVRFYYLLLLFPTTSMASPSREAPSDRPGGPWQCLSDAALGLIANIAARSTQWRASAANTTVEDMTIIYNSIRALKLIELYVEFHV
jgi:hypothetical protein